MSEPSTPAAAPCFPAGPFLAVEAEHRERSRRRKNKRRAVALGAVVGGTVLGGAAVVGVSGAWLLLVAMIATVIGASWTMLVLGWYAATARVLDGVEARLLAASYRVDEDEARRAIVAARRAVDEQDAARR